ncbi:carbon monoxide dehydrogenase subunit G [Kitasatospora sp. MAP12-15]|uniref:hypothetical protein n=1 Tax=unclassified Kitasatospora TaxID=2633591 RepID=UPI0024770455|nr:hypothetical protein [Kitasatospora sp. MAP12-44]MDH6111782.1 carbon monoxide dehydrogenase subunit G [Kitasatospora sp. MAP12-44]
MEHEVVVPLPVALVHSALQDPALLARCVPGLSTDAAEPTDGRAVRRASGPGTPEEINGRLRVRIGGSTITYRGVVSLIRSGAAGVLTAFAEGQEARGDGEVLAALRISVEQDGEERTVLRFRGDLTPGGRLTEFDEAALALAGRRLLDRFGASLATEGGDTPEAEPSAPIELKPKAAADEETEGDELPDDLFADDLSDLIAFSDSEGFGLAAEPENPDDLAAAAAAGRGAESMDAPYGYQPFGNDPLSPDDVLAGPVRRSIVGRSAEEVDHAPPRGRYAPALPARSARARAASRWSGEHGGGAPVAARVHNRAAVPWVIGGSVALLGGAVVLARALRKR